MTIKLWELSADMDAISDEIMANGGEVTEEMEARLDALDGSFTEKVERVALYIRQVKLTADAAKAEKDRLAAIQKRYDTEARGLKAYLLRHLEHQGHAKIETAKVRVRVQKSPPSIKWTGGPFDIPDNYRVVNYSFDATQAKADHKAGVDLPEGIVITTGTHIRIS